MNEIKGGGASVELSEDLNVITAEINAYQRVAGEAIFEIGRRLKGVRDNPQKYGFAGFRDWEKWCNESLNITRRHANDFIKVFDRFENHGSPLPGTISALRLLTSYSDEELEKPREMPNGSTKKLTEMSRREIEEFKAREKKAVEEKEKALLAAEEAVKARKQAEEQRDMALRESDILRDTLESMDAVEPEVRTEYIKNDRAETELNQYKELFGDISMYEGKATRVTNADAITYSVFEFEEDVRRFVEKYGHLTHFPREFSAMISEGKSEYKNSIQTLFSLLKQLDRNLDESETIIIELP